MITFAEVLLEVRKYMTEDYKLDLIKKAYKIAEKAHEGVVRESGEPYIQHPLAVMKILVEMHQDVETICAGLLHDVIEDTTITKKKLENLFIQSIHHVEEIEKIEEIVNLVEGVTKVKSQDYDIQILKETCKDERIIIIKLADRLHNMRTIQGKKNEAKRKKIALKTFNIFVPWAKYLGAYKIKYELEDLCFQEIAPISYRNICQYQEAVRNFAEYPLKLAREELERSYEGKQLYFYPKIKDAYGIYKAGYPPLETGQKKSVTEEMLNDPKVIDTIKENYRSVNELVQLKVIVPEKEDCYEIANLLQEKYRDEIFPSTVRDYIETPKKNMYQSYDMIIDGMMFPIQYQIRTERMDLVNCYGPNYMDIKNRTDIRTDFITRLQNSLIQCTNDEEILKSFMELSTKKIRVFDLNSMEYQMDPGNTIVDLYYKMGGKDPREITGAVVNGIDVRMNYALEDNDQVSITTKELKKKR